MSHDAGQHTDPPPKRPPLQFSLATLLAVTTGLAMLFGALNWMGISTQAGAIVLIVVALSALAAVGLVVAIASARDDGEDEERMSDER
jgi:predicted RND superfamily exporter protein